MVENNESVGLTRRETLKRGAKLGGAVLWMTPVVQAVGMRPAFAQSTSPVCNVWYAVKIDPSSGGCVDIFDQGSPTGGQCLDVDNLDVPPVAGGCAHIAGFTTPSDPAPWTVTLEEGCEFKACFVKAGRNCTSGGCNWDPTTRTITFPNPGSPEISHVEIAFCCSE